MNFLLIFLFIFGFSMNSYPQQPEELRGVWITNVDSDVLISNDKQISEAMDYLASIGINVIFPVMWNNGYTLYPSNIMSTLFGRKISPKANGRDPLQRLIIEAHRNGIEVIPWMEYGFASSYSKGTINDTIISKFPNWATKFNDGTICTDGKNNTGFVWMSGINTEVQDFIISLISEIIDNYDVDGIQGDDRLPALPVEGGYDSTTVAIYKSEHNGKTPPENYKDEDWKKWRAEKLNDFFSRLRDSVKARSKHLILSSAPSPYYWGYDDHLQDSKSWVNRSIVDNFIPQIYPDPPLRDMDTYKWILAKTMSDLSEDKKKIFFPGILARVGSYVAPSDQLVNYVKENRQKGLNGETYFFYEGLTGTNKVNGEALRKSCYLNKALLPYRNGLIWRPRAIAAYPQIKTPDHNSGLLQQSSHENANVNNYVSLTNKNKPSKISYEINVPYESWFDLYIYNSIDSSPSDSTHYQIFSEKDSSIFRIDKNELKKEGWIKLKDIYLKKGIQKLISLDIEEKKDRKSFQAPKVMIMINRKLSPEVIISNDQEEISNNY